MALTERQMRERAYHRDRAAEVSNRYERISFDVIESPNRRWWNGYWQLWTDLLSRDLQGKRVVVVGCGAGEDALYFAKLGAVVFAFDLSSDMLDHGRRLAAKYGLTVEFTEAACEHLPYKDGTFDVVFARDILHHVDIPKALSEMRRVSKPQALWVVNEVYSHSWTELIRRSWFVDRLLYPVMRRFIYGPIKPYITDDERKMTEIDIAVVMAHLHDVQITCFNFFVTRLVPARWTSINKLDRAVLMMLGTLGTLFAGRLIIIGKLGAKD